MRAFNNLTVFTRLIFILWTVTLFSGLLQELHAQNSFPYILSEPLERYDLPKELLEISGISIISDSSVGMVQDELGKLYVFDLMEKKVNEVFDFTDHGDFEGLEVVGNTAYILRSDGTIFELENYGAEHMKINKYSTFLTAKNDTEGLCYDSTTKSLLITCKSSPSNPEKSYKGNRAVYIFSLDTHKLEEKPFLLINRAYIEMRMNDDDQNFKPAGIAIHPKTGDIYMTASSGQLLVVTDREGKVKWVKKLKKKRFSQPEGITFSSDGTMYISSEGVDGPGYLLAFKFQPE